MGKKITIGAITSFLACIILIVTQISTIKGWIDGYIVETVRENVKGGTRHALAEAWGVRDEEVLPILASFRLSLDSINTDRSAIKRYMQSIVTIKIWNEMQDYAYKDWQGKYDPYSRTYWHLHNGFIFEAYFKSSQDAFYFQTSYGEEIKCENNG